MELTSHGYPRKDDKICLVYAVAVRLVWHIQGTVELAYLRFLGVGFLHAYHM